VRATPVAEAEKPKAFIHWVADPLEVEVRQLFHLLKGRFVDSGSSLLLFLFLCLRFFSRTFIQFIIFQFMFFSSTGLISNGSVPFFASKIFFVGKKSLTRHQIISGVWPEFDIQ
jgi:hypothetical protein